MNKEEFWDWLLEREIATEDELRLVAKGWGFTVENLETVLYVKTGYDSPEQYEEEEY